LSKVAYLNLPHPHLGLPLGVTPFEFCPDLRHQKTKNLWAIVWHCLRDPMLSRFSRTLLVTDRQTDRHMKTAYTVLAWHRAVKSAI